MVGLVLVFDGIVFLEISFLMKDNVIMLFIYNKNIAIFMSFNI